MRISVALIALPLALASSTAMAGWEVSEPSLGTIVMGIDMTDNLNGLAAGAANGSGPVIWRTLDGGDTWRVADDELLTMSYMDISMTQSGFGVTGGMGMFYVMAGSTRTIDDGRTWTKNGPPQFFAVYQDVEAIDDQHAALVGSWGSLRSYGEGMAYTADGGNSWSFHEWGIDTWPRYVSFASAEVGFMSGGHWPTESTRSMTPWTGRAISSRLRMPSNLNYSDQKTEATGYRGVVARTDDGGQTWTSKLDVDGLYFNGIHFIDDLNGWVVGEGEDSASIYHTSDGGETWVEQWSGEAVLMQVRMVNNRIGWAAGGDLSTRFPTTLILRTTDGGQTWLPDPVEGDFIMFNIDAVDATHAWGVGYNLGNGQCGVLKYSAE